MTREDNERPAGRRSLFTRTHHRRSLSRWVIPLIIILLVIFFLPRLVDLLLAG